MKMTGTVSGLWRNYAIYQKRINCRYPQEAGAAPAARLAFPNRVAIPCTSPWNYGSGPTENRKARSSDSSRRTSAETPRCPRSQFVMSC